MKGSHALATFALFALLGAADYFLGTLRVMLFLFAALLLILPGLFTRVLRKLDEIQVTRLQNQKTLERCLATLSKIADQQHNRRN